MDAEKFLFDKGIINRRETFPINLTRDTHIGTKEKLIQAMDEYASLKSSHSISMNQLYLAMIIYRKTLVTNDKEKTPIMSTVKLIEAEDGKSAQKKLEEHWMKTYRAFTMIKVELSEVIR